MINTSVEVFLRHPEAISKSLSKFWARAVGGQASSWKVSFGSCQTPASEQTPHLAPSSAANHLEKMEKLNACGVQLLASHCHNVKGFALFSFS